MCYLLYCLIPSTFIVDVTQKIFFQWKIPEIKSRLTLRAVLSYYNLKPYKNLRLNCPFHEDKTPSLQVYYKTHTACYFSSNCKTLGNKV